MSPEGYTRISIYITHITSAALYILKARGGHCWNAFDRLGRSVGTEMELPVLIYRSVLTVNLSKSVIVNFGF